MSNSHENSKMRNTTFLLPLLLVSFLVSPYIQSQVHFINGRYMTEWLILGPIPGINLEEDYLASVNGESKIEPKVGDSFKTKDEIKLTWKRHQSAHRLVDLLPILGSYQHPDDYPFDDSTAYAFAYIDSPKADDDIQFMIGKDDGAAVWINGKNVYLNPENSSHRYDDGIFRSSVNYFLDV